jgi:hypothetical protein
VIQQVLSSHNSTSASTPLLSSVSLRRLFSLAPHMDHVPSPAVQGEFLNALQAYVPDFHASFIRFPARTFKRLSVKEAETALLDLVQDAFTADVLHLHLDWYCYLGRFSPHHAMGLWMQLFQIFRDKPLLLFGHEVPTFLDNPLMIKERVVWQQWCEHFRDTPHHRLLLHQPTLQSRWESLGFPVNRIQCLPKPLVSQTSQNLFPVDPHLYHVVKKRLQQGQVAQETLSPLQVIGFIPHEEDTDSVFVLRDLLLQAPPHVVLLVMGGSNPHRPEFPWEQALLKIIQDEALSSRILMTGPVTPREEITYLNLCQAVYVAHRHQVDALQRKIQDCLQQGVPVWLPSESDTVQGLRCLFQDSWQNTCIRELDAAALGEAASTLLEVSPLPGRPLLQAMQADSIALRYLKQYHELAILNSSV